MKQVSLRIITSCRDCQNSKVELLHKNQNRILNSKVKLLKKDSVFICFCSESGMRLMSSKEYDNAFTKCPLPAITEGDFTKSTVFELLDFISKKTDGFDGTILCKAVN